MILTVIRIIMVNGPQYPGLFLYPHYNGHPKILVDGMKRFPAARHFAGAIGTAVKSALSGKTDKLVDLLPFILIAIELFEDPEVFEFIMNAIESEDDLWVWVEYIAEVVGLEGGLDALAFVDGVGGEQMVAENPVLWLVPNANASASRIAAKIIEHIQNFIRKALGKAKSITNAMRALSKHPALFKIVLKSGTAIRYFAALGAARIAYFVRESRNWRVNRWFVLFSVAYLTEEHAAGRLTLQNGGLTGVIAKVFSGNKNDASGSQFQLSQIAYYHGKSQIDNSQPKVLAIEEFRPSFEVVNGEKVGDSYKRRVDIILEGPEKDGEDWIEVKSYAQDTMRNSSKFLNDPSSDKSNYREFFHDLRLNENFIVGNENGYRDIILADPRSASNDQYTWYFHKFSRGKGVSPKSKDVGKVQGWLCAKPARGLKGGLNNFYKYNMAKSPPATKKTCDKTSKQRITLRDTESYVREIIQGLADKLGLTIGDFVIMVQAIPEDSEWY